MVIMAVNGRKIRIEDSDDQGAVRTVVVDGRSVQVELVQELSQDPMNLLLRVGDRALRVDMPTLEQDSSIVRLNGRPLEVALEPSEAKVSDRERSIAREGPMIVNAPMSGRITVLKAALGATVDDGEALVVLEAMKMENEIGSPKKGVVREIYVQEGALVKAGDKLVLVN